MWNFQPHVTINTTLSHFDVLCVETDVFFLPQDMKHFNTLQI